MITGGSTVNASSFTIANGAVVVNYNVTLDKLVPESILAINKDIYFGVILRLKRKNLKKIK